MAAYGYSGRILRVVLHLSVQSEYYKLRGWDVATGLQTKKQLEGIGLGDIVSEMEERGLVG
jgi:hypothetical protein